MWKIKMGKCIYESPNGVQVHQNLFYRWLTFGNDAVQSLISRRYPEKPRLNYIPQLTLAARAVPSDCCLLGLGGAGVAHALAPHLGESTLLAVESNHEVIKVAADYFMTSRLKNMDVVHQDAKLFVEQCETRYQHLMVDLFDADAFPTHCTTPDFFENCRRMLLPHGVLALNLTNVREQWGIFNQVRDLFCQRTVSLPVKGAANMVVLASNSASITPLLDLVSNNPKVKRMSWDAKWGCIAEM